MTDCLFCKIGAGQIPSKKVFEDDRIFAFEDVNPKAPVHILLIPRKHIAKLSDMTAEDGALAGEIAMRAVAIARERGVTDFRLLTNNGKQAGQAIFHLHFHLLAGRPMGWPPG